MRFRRREPLLSVLLDTGLNLIDSLRERMPDNIDEVRGRVRDTYDTASTRVSRAADALRGEEESQLLGKGVALLVGVGLGVGIGLLMAPASGEATRAYVADKVSEFTGRVQEATEQGMPEDE